MQMTSSAGHPAPAEAPAQRRERLLRQRQQHYGRNAALHYGRDALLIVRGEGARLYDAEGGAYLDCVNNVAHLGHAHPKVSAPAVPF